MRAVLIYFVIGVFLFAGAAALSISRAECDRSNDSAELVASDEVTKSTKSEPSPAEIKPQSENSSAILQEAMNRDEKHLSPAEAEMAIGSAIVDEQSLWGDPIHWCQIRRQFSYGDDFQTDYLDSASSNFGLPEPRRPAVVRYAPSVGAYQERNYAGKAYQTAARKLESIANDLEEAQLFHDADTMRQFAQKLRVQARLLPWDEREESSQNFSFFTSSAR